MKVIVQRSTAIVTFVSLLSLTLTTPQRLHVERFADLLVVAPRRKTLAQLAALELEGVDPSNLADFFRISPWDPDDLRRPLLKFVIAYLNQRNHDPACPIYLTIDDSLTPKDKATRHLQSVDWHFDHNQQRTIRGGCHVVLRIHWGAFHFPLLWRLYLRETTVRRLNRRRTNTKLRYQSKLALAREMLQQVHSLLPKTNPVYVLFDSWYTSAKLMKWIRQQGWHCDRGHQVQSQVVRPEVDRLASRSQGLRLPACVLGTGEPAVADLLCPHHEWTPEWCSRPVRVLFSQKGPGVRTPKYFVCTDVKLSAQEILRRYQHRWSQEVDYWYVKLQLGLGDFRLQRHEAISKWYAVVVLGARLFVLAEIRDQEALR